MCLFKYLEYTSFLLKLTVKKIFSKNKSNINSNEKSLFINSSSSIFSGDLKNSIVSIN